MSVGHGQIIECADGYYCCRCGKIDDEKCEPPISEVDISWEIAIVTLEEAARKYAESKTDERLFTYNPETIKRTADRIKRYYTERHQRWQLEYMKAWR